MRAGGGGGQERARLAARLAGRERVGDDRGNEANCPESIMSFAETDAAVSPEDLLRQRYRMDWKTPVQWNPVLETLIGHRSVRHFLPKALPEGTLELLVAAAQSASTSSNMQLWSVVAIEDQERKARLAELAAGQKHIREAPLFLAWLADLRRVRALGEARNAEMIGPDYLEMGMVAMIDAALAAQNAFAAMESLGLGGVYIGALRNHPEQVAEELGLPDNVFCVFGLCVGYPDPAAGEAIKPRLPQSAVLYREQYGETPDPAEIAAYDTRLREFQNEQRMNGIDWSTQMVNRAGHLKGLMGRERMREALANLGFPLK
jgi:nitroreductase